LPASEAADAAAMAARLADCVREAGVLARSMFGQTLRQWTKGASSPVCDADIAVDELLRRRLCAIDGSIAWLSEESIDDPARLDARFVFIVDPIDGTRAYLAGRPDWAVSVALVADGRPIAGCLYAPVPDRMFVAALGRGATCNGAPMAATTGTALADLRIAGPKRLADDIGALAPRATIMPRVHSLALRLAGVAQGAFDVAFAGDNSHDWDLAAADLLVHEAGGALTSLQGGAVTYNRPVPRHGALVAAGRDRHAALVELLGQRRMAS
jgi:myo-inositol-1(or 4)-monophosphatase